MSIISVRSLCKEFSVSKSQKGFWKNVSSFFSKEREKKIALDNISFEVKEGELVGYIGPNGSGKSTTVKILTGILVPNQGDVKIMEKTPWENRVEVVQNIGVVFGQRTQLWWDLPVIESFKLLKKIYRILDKDYQNKLKTLVEVLDLDKLLNIPVRQLSLGQRMRVDLAASMIHSPKILFLDEPTIGLDAVSKLAVRDFIRYLNKEEKVTVMLTTHDMDDIEDLCKRVLVLNNGKIFLDGTLEELRNQISLERRLIVDLKDQKDQVKPASYFSIIKQEGHRVWLSFDPTLITPTELINKITSLHSISDLFVENVPIEEVIAKFYKKERL